jgi:colanic acid/amylovoran biosynthesis glycosyltransferase
MQLPDPLRVGYVLKRYPRFSETFVVNEILAHERAGLPIDIFALGPVAETHFQDCIGQVRAAVTRVPEKLRASDALWQLVTQAQRRLPRFWDAARDTVGLDGDDVAQSITIALAAQQRGISHLHAHFATSATGVARAAARFAGISYSFTAHAKDIYFRYEEPLHLDLKLRDAACAVTVSDYNLAHLRDLHGPLAARMVRLYNGLDLQRFTYEAPVGRAPLVLAVGRLVDKKGFRVLVEAARVLLGRGVDFCCRVIGDGPERVSLQAQIDGCGMAAHVQLDGPRPQAEVVAAMRAAAVLAAPCVVSEDGNRDGLPTVLLEAMALGTPCVSTQVTGIPELVRHGDTGLCVAPDDPDALADALQRVLGDEGLRLQLARAARQAIERDFDIDVNSRQLRGLFGQAAQAARHAQAGQALQAARHAAAASAARVAVSGAA